MIKITKDNITTYVGGEKPVLLDFSATWCGPCGMIAPHLEELAKEYPDIVFGKIDVDEEGELAEAFGIISIPTLILVKNGEEVGKQVGYLNKNQLLRFIGKD